MSHDLEHYVSKFLGYVWLITLVVGSVAALCWVVKALLRVIGVI